MASLRHDPSSSIPCDQPLLASGVYGNNFGNKLQFVSFFDGPDQQGVFKGG